MYLDQVTAHQRKDMTPLLLRFFRVYVHAHFCVRKAESVLTFYSINEVMVQHRNIGFFFHN